MLVCALAGAGCVAIDTTTFCQRYPDNSQCNPVEAGSPDSVPSDAPADADVIVAAVCSPGESSCRGGLERRCSADGRAWAETVCEIGCGATACLRVTDLSARNSNQTCAIISDGSVRCWGNRTEGTSRPTSVAGIAEAVEVNSLRDTFAVRTRNGEVWWWGDTYPNSETNPTLRPPQQVIGPRDSKSIAVGVRSLCVIIGDQRDVLCTGLGPFGDGTKADYPDVRVIPRFRGATSLVLSWSRFALFDKSALGWGINVYGELGLGFDSPQELTAQPTYSGATTIRAGAIHTCGLLPEGNLRCYGYNLNAVLGDGPEGNQTTGVLISGPGSTPITQLDLASSYMCAVFADKTVGCMGGNAGGRLGDGTKDNRSVFTRVPELTNVTKVVTGEGHACALSTEGTVRCWGANDSGQIGDGRGGTSGAVALKPTAPAW
jgi:alpha-tubulin suppressor-like RCC1 family protein